MRTPAALAAQLPTAYVNTIYASFGRRLGWVCLGGFLVLVAWVVVARKRPLIPRPGDADRGPGSGSAARDLPRSGPWPPATREQRVKRDRGKTADPNRPQKRGL